MRPLAVARYRYRFRVVEPMQLPAYAGALLRGQFGASLRRVACMTGAESCTGCPLRSTCAYTAIFESPAPDEHAMQKFSHVPNPYVLEPPADGARRLNPGETLEFGLVLVGKAIEHLPLITFCLRRTLDRGFGESNGIGRGELQEVAWQSRVSGPGVSPAEWIVLWEPSVKAMLSHPAQSAAPLSLASTSLRLRLLTPLRLQHNGRPLGPSELTPRKFIADLLRRVTLLGEFHGDLVPAIEDPQALVQLASTLHHEAELHWFDWSRYSSRQKQEMSLGGVLGEWRWHGDLAPLLPYLWLGQWLHVGKNATMGLGHFTLE